MFIYFQKCCGSLTEVSRARETWIGTVSHIDAGVVFVKSRVSKMSGGPGGTGLRAFCMCSHSYMRVYS